MEHFGSALTGLTVDDIRSIASDLHAVCASPADEVAGARAMLIIEQTVHHTRRTHAAAVAAFTTATKVQEIAQRAELDLPDTDVTCVARAAAQLARGMVVRDYPGVDHALHVLGRGWHRVPGLAEFQAA